MEWMKRNPITTSDIPRYVLLGIKASIVSCFTGAPGIGKTASYVRAHKLVAEFLGLKPVAGEPKDGEFGLWISNMSHLMDVDAGGLPYVTKDYKQRRAMLDMFPKKGPGLWCVEEIAQNLDMSKILSQLFHDRQINNDYFVPDGVHMIASANLQEHRAGSAKMYTHLVNRMAMYYAEPTVAGWMEANPDADASVLAYLNWFPDHLILFDPSVDGPYPSPRSWTALNRLVLTGDPPLEYQAAYRGEIGKTAEEYLAVHTNITQVPNIDGLLHDPDPEDIKRLSQNRPLQCCLSVMLAKRMKKESDLFDKSIVLMESVAGPEQVAAFGVMATTINKKLKDSAAYGKLIARNNKVHF